MRLCLLVEGLASFKTVFHGRGDVKKQLHSGAVFDLALLNIFGEAPPAVNRPSSGVPVDRVREGCTPPLPLGAGFWDVLQCQGMPPCVIKRPNQARMPAARPEHDLNLQHTAQVPWPCLHIASQQRCRVHMHGCDLRG